MSPEMFVVRFESDEAAPVQWVEDLIAPQFGNPFNDYYPQFTKDRSKAYQMSEKEAKTVAHILRYDGTATVERLEDNNAG